MTGKEHGLRSSHHRPMPRVRRIENKQEILTLLEADRLFAAYPVAEMETALSSQYDWLVAEDEDDVALCVLYKGLSPNPLYMSGSESGIAVMLGSALRPPYVTFTCEPRHLPVLQVHYRIGDPETMVRMSVMKARFKPCSGEVEGLTAAHLDELKALYKTGGLDLITAERISRGLYKGVRLAGELVSVAGTHAISPSSGMAIVGNVFTHPEHRNRGYAAACTSAVTEELLRSCRDVVLNVSAANDAAIKVYAKMGYREHCRFIQTMGVRKGTAHLSTFADRLKSR